MRRLLALPVCSILLLTAATALADLPLPKDIKYVDPRVRFEGIDKYTDHVFYLRFLTFTGGPFGIPHTLMEVKDARPFQLNAQRRVIDMQLLALERKDFDKRKKDDPSLRWLNDKTDGVLRATVVPPSTTGSVKDKEVPVTTYRVSLKDGKLSAELVKEKERSDASPTGLLPLWVFGLVTALALTLLGLWFARWQNVAP